MPEVFVGSLLLVPYTFAPKGYELCQGQLLPVAKYTALFSLLGKAYGGDGVRTFGLPNLQGYLPVGCGQGPGLSSYPLGGSAGTLSETLSNATVPPHNHTINGDKNNANSSNPVGCSLGNSANIYSAAATNLVAMNPQSVPPLGGGRPHNNVMPYQVLNWVIATEGLYPQ